MIILMKLLLALKEKYNILSKFMTEEKSLVDSCVDSASATVNQQNQVVVASLAEDDIFLNDTWNLYFHDPYDTNWNNSSYVRLTSICSVDDFWKTHLSLKNNLHKGMFFIMRDGIFPAWDSTQNINGGCLSIKVLKEHMADFWEDLTIKMLGETLIKEAYRSNWSSVNGISTSPKKNFCIIKIWVKDNKISNKELLNVLPKYHGDIIYKSNLECITNENLARTTAIPTIKV